MSTEWMQDIFSAMFFLYPQGDHFQCFEGEKSPVLCTKNIFPVFMTDIRCFYQSLYCILSQLHTILLQKQEICSHKMFVHKTGHFSQKH